MQHWDNRGDWNHQQWFGPNGGELNHVGYWGPNGYWGHTGYWGPNGGHYGHSSYWGPAGHWSRNWGGWYHGWGPAWGYGGWGYLWDQYPAAMAFGATMWGLNSVNAAFGVSDYYNPYCDGPVYVNNQPVVYYTQPIVGDAAYQTAGNQSSDQSSDSSTDPLTALFDQARQAFYNGQYDQALTLTNQALAQAPRDAAINEFRALCLFALGQYRDASATIHAVLAAGPGWDWTTMISLYADKDDYTEQLRKLEQAVEASPQSADLRFLLAYEYLTMDHKDDAVALWKTVVELQPKDKLSADLVKMYTPASAQSTQTAQAPVPNLQKPAYPMDKLYGDWSAQDKSGQFALHLGKDDEFTWKFSQDGKPQTVSGAYMIQGDNLVMQPNTGGTMLSTIKLQNDQTLAFNPIGGATALTFHK